MGECVLEQERYALGNGVGGGDAIKDDVDGRLECAHSVVSQPTLGDKKTPESKGNDATHHDELVDAVAGEEVAQQVVEPALHGTRELDPLLESEIHTLTK
jgi:hypothetical protein